MSRFISIALTVILAMQMVLSTPEVRDYSLFPLMVFGLLIGFALSLNFAPSHPLRKHIFGPTLAWPIMAWGIYYFLSQSGLI